jgi:hypothetical protein
MIHGLELPSTLWNFTEEPLPHLYYAYRPLRGLQFPTIRVVFVRKRIRTLKLYLHIC